MDTKTENTEKSASAVKVEGAATNVKPVKTAGSQGPSENRRGAQAADAGSEFGRHTGQPDCGRDRGLPRASLDRRGGGNESRRDS